MTDLVAGIAAGIIALLTAAAAGVVTFTTDPAPIRPPTTLEVVADTPDGDVVVCEWSGPRTGQPEQCYLTHPTVLP